MKISSLGLSRQALLISALFLSGLSASNANTLEENLELMESQSPIDIRSDNTYYGKLAPLKFDLDSDTSLAVINNGSPDHESTIRANVSAGAGSLLLSGHEWNLAQFHFHTPSEHLINSRGTPMEMHLVFADSANDLLVVSRGIRQGLFDNQSLDPIFSDLPQTTDETLHIDHFNLNTLLPDYLGSFRYSGSLTTPPFSENVSWVQLASPLYLSGGQIDAFESLFPEGNSREVQELNGRIVLTDVPGFVDHSGESGTSILNPILDPILGPLIPHSDALKVGALDNGDISLTEPAFAAAVPEPETYAMLLAGLILIGFAGIRQNKRRVVNPDFSGSAA